MSSAKFKVVTIWSYASNPSNLNRGIHVLLITQVLLELLGPLNGIVYQLSIKGYVLQKLFF
jgi:hypothetical protein